MPENNKLMKFAQGNLIGITILTLISALRQIGKPITPHLVTTPDARYLFLMGVHGIGKFGQEAILKENIQDVDVAFLESGAYPYFGKDNLFEFPRDQFEEMAFYHKLIPALRENNIPILFGDIPFSRLSGFILLALGSLTSLGATIAGISLATNSRGKNSSLKKSWGAAIGIWGVSALFKRLVTVDPDFIIRKKGNINLRKTAFYSELIHPENVLEMLRNAVIAKKLIFYAKNYQKSYGRIPTIAVVMGSGHELIAEYLQRGEEFCQKVIGIYPKFILKLILEDQLQTYLPSLVEVKHNRGVNEGRVMVDPGLASLV